MDFTVFDTRKLDEYAERAKQQWGQSEQYKEFEEKAKDWTKEDELHMANDFMKVFEEFGAMKHLDPAAEQVQAQVKKLQDYITEHFYKCTNEILLSLGKMYSGGGEFTENIDKAGGEGNAEFTAKAIEIFCK